MDELEKAMQKSRRKARKKSQPRTTHVTARGAQQRGLIAAFNAELEAGLQKVDRIFENKERRVKGRYQTKKDIEAKARAQYKAGKIKRGQLTKTIERRWQATQKREAAALEKLATKRKAEKIALRDRLRKNPPAPALRSITVEVTFRISSDVKSARLTFQTSGEIEADARDALADYMQADDADLVSLKVLQ